HRPRPLRLARRRQLRPARPVGGRRARAPRRHAMTPPPPAGSVSHAVPPPPPAGSWFESDPLWFKRAVFYEIHLRGFFDANADGSGDFRGLTEKLDYLQLLRSSALFFAPRHV